MFGVENMPNKKYVLKNKKKFYSFIFIISLVAFLIIYTNSVAGYEEPQYQSIVVSSGDTLWSIAKKYGNDSDIREYIHKVKEINNLDSSVLYDNTAILVPINE